MEDNKRPLILVSNDDGIDAPGVARLVELLLTLGDVVCVCPLTPQSGKSMAITVTEPLRIQERPSLGTAQMYAVDGTPVDCVKIALHTILDRLPDLMVSGINHGSNAAINVVYSGTMGAAFEACAWGIPAVGFSLTSHSLQADFAPAMPFVEAICRATLAHGLPGGICLNVNVPAHCTPSRMALTRSARGKWTDEYREYTDPAGRKFYMLTGRFQNAEPDNPDTDEWCLAHGTVSVVPCLLDRTAPSSEPLPWLAELAAGFRTAN